MRLSVTKLMDNTRFDLKEETIVSDLDILSLEAIYVLITRQEIVYAYFGHAFSFKQ